MALSFAQPITLSLSLLQRMACNNDGKHKMEEEAESSTVTKWLQLSDDDGGDDSSSDSSDSPEEVSSEVSYPILCQNQVLIVCMTQDQLFYT
jgi:hypothetical protein